MNSIKKTDALFSLIKLKEEGKNQEAIKVQKLIIESVKKDSSHNIYSKNIDLDRRSKKTLKFLTET